MNMNMGSTAASPVQIADEEENDDDVVSVVEGPASESGRRRRRRRRRGRGRGTDIQNAISVDDDDDDYSDYIRDLQHAMIASLPPHNNSKKTIIDLDDVQVLDFWPPFPPKIPTKPFASRACISIREPGESSSNSKSIKTFMCEICVEPKPYTESFSINGCTHSYCSDCMIKYVASKLQDNITQIRCPVPDCKGLLEPDQCRSILPPDVFDRWGSALCEAVILASEKFYCPFKDCSALLIDDRLQGEEAITQSECPDCRRLFCVQCKVAWHSGIECGEYQKLNKDEREREDILLMKLAKNNNWRRCSMCRFYVERSAGCLFMKCRCGYTFCYNCGAHLKDHYCSICKH